MPIRKSERHRYPKNWKQIADSIRERAGYRCEGSPAYPDCRVEHMKPHPERGHLVRITVAHLDHKPENCDPSNLRAWCERCHFKYDEAHHARNAAATRRARLNNRELFPTLAGVDTRG